jgi:hypothetical protein
MKGIHLSGPIFFEIKPEGNSAARKDSRNMVWPVLKSFVSIPSSVKRSSEIAVRVSEKSIAPHSVKSASHTSVDVAAIEIERRKHEPTPEHDPEIDLLNN